MKHKRAYIYTNKSHSPKGVMSTVFGALAFVTIALALYFTFRADGAASQRYAAAGILSLIFALTGMILGIMARMEEDRYYLFAYIGLLCNFLVFSLDAWLFALGLGIV